MSKKARRIKGGSIIIIVFIVIFFMIKALEDNGNGGTTIVDGDKDSIMELEDWNNFSPKSLGDKPDIFELKASEYFDLDNGLAYSTRRKGWDLTFSRAPGGSDYLRASKGVSWSSQGIIDFNRVKYTKIRDTKYSSPKHVKTGQRDIFVGYGSSVPRIGAIFFVKTNKGNLAKIQIKGYRQVDINPKVARNIVLKYEVFPVVKSPPRPKR